MTHVNTTLIRVPADLTASGYHKGRAFEVIVCIYDPLDDKEEEWVKLNTILACPTNYRIDHIKTVGIVLACTRAGTAWNATVIVGGYAHVANYWMVAGLVAGSTIGVRFSGSQNNAKIEKAVVCVIPSSKKEVNMYNPDNNVNENLSTEDGWNLNLKIATYNGKSSHYFRDGIIPEKGHDPLFRDPIPVVACQHSPYTFLK